MTKSQQVEAPRDKKDVSCSSTAISNDECQLPEDGSLTLLLDLVEELDLDEEKPVVADCVGLGQDGSQETKEPQDCGTCKCNKCCCEVVVVMPYTLCDGCLIRCWGVMVEAEERG